MDTIKVEATIQRDGELHLTALPFRKGEKVQATVVGVTSANETNSSGTDGAAEKKRQEALQRFLARASASKFRSIGPYPTRDELHERR